MIRTYDPATVEISINGEPLNLAPAEPGAHTATLHLLPYPGTEHQGPPGSQIYRALQNAHALDQFEQVLCEQGSRAGAAWLREFGWQLGPLRGDAVEMWRNVDAMDREMKGLG